MVGSVEAAGRGARIGHVAAAALGGFVDQQVEQSELLVAANREIARRAEHAEHVGVDDSGGLADRVERVGGIIFAAEKAFLFGRHKQEHHRTLGPRAGGEGARLLDDMADAGAVIDRAIINPVALRIGKADAEMVPVGGVDHGFVGPRRAGQDSDDIFRGDDLGLGRCR